MAPLRSNFLKNLRIFYLSFLKIQSLGGCMKTTEGNESGRGNSYNFGGHKLFISYIATFKWDENFAFWQTACDLGLQVTIHLILHSSDSYIFD